MTGDARELPDARRLVGAVLSRRFRLVKLLGEGGMGAVFEAAPTDGSAHVAVKLLHEEHLETKGVVDRFEEEGRLGVRFDHPNVVRVFEVARAENGAPYLVMELLDGVSLGAYTRTGTRIPPAQAVLILQAVLAGLDAAHGHGVVHRDLKPDNVQLARAPNGTYAVKILDFGVAKVMDALGGPERRTRTGMLLGTPAYMSPEQVLSAKTVDGRSDLFSAASLFFEMLAGRPAFGGDTEFSKLSAVVSANPPTVSQVDARLGAFDPFLAKALAKAPADRFQSAREMARGLLDAAARFGAAPATGVGGSMAPPPGLAALPPTAPPPSLASPVVYLPPVVAAPSAPAAPLTPGRETANPRGASSTLASGAHTPIALPVPRSGAREPPDVVVHGSARDRRRVPLWALFVAVFVAFLLGVSVGLLLGRGMA